MNKKSLIATAFLALAGVTGISTYSSEVRAEGVPVQDLALVQEEENPELMESEPNTQYYYGRYHRRHRSYYGRYRRAYSYYGGYRRYYGGYRSYYGGYRSYYGGYRGYYRYEHEPQDGISTDGLETPEIEENRGRE